MKPDITPAPSEPPKATTAEKPVEKPAEAALAEPPKNLEFTEVPSEELAALPTPPAASEAPKGETPGTPKPEGKPKDVAQAPAGPAAKPQVASAVPPKKVKVPKGQRGPGLIISFAVLVFAALAVVAYEAYSKSK